MSTQTIAPTTDIHDGPTVKEAAMFAGRLGIDLSDFMSAVMRLIGEARDRTPRELRRDPEVTAELAGRDA